MSAGLHCHCGNSQATARQTVPRQYVWPVRQAGSAAAWLDALSDSRILDVGYKVDAANNEVLNQSYRELLDYEEKWAKTISESSDIAEIRQATKDLNNAISRFNTRAKKVDPSIAKDIYNKKFSSMLNSFNNKLDDFYNGARRTEEATNLIVGDTGAKNTIEDMARAIIDW